ncbi:hypothetical protein [Streptomyces inusitatus]|uniref:hypothetical protein n=1 Tax=Streptomyces inusitatus TaxID=68221 RepID=UPI00167DEB68|nr:hypothetical protein [Streptomyces inusitatus]
MGDPNCWVGRPDVRLCLTGMVRVGVAAFAIVVTPEALLPASALRRATNRRWIRT